jgi:2'-5' RNA ligase
MRTFIAIDLPSYIKEKIYNITEIFKGCNLNAKWVEKDNFHMTLKFLGEIEEKKLEGIKKIIEIVANKFHNFEINLKEFGFFPNEKNPRVFFLSTDKEEALKTIATNLEEELENIGFPKENRFKSHITLARFKSRKNLDCLKRKIKEVAIQEKFTINGITLFKSTLTKYGPIYEEIFKKSLKE